MKPFAVRLGIDTPISLTNLLHLDAMLGKVAFDRGGDLENIPLARRDGIWMGSAAVLETGPFGLSSSTIKRVKAIRDDNIPAGVLDGLPRKDRVIGEMSPFRPRLTSYPVARAVTAVWFFGTGDAAEVQDMLQDIPGIGAMHTVRYGRVTSIEILDCEDAPDVGLQLADNLPARTVPVSTWQHWGYGSHSRAVVSEQRWRPPYWTGDRVPCISPIQQDMTGTRRQIVSAFRVTSC